MELCRQPVVRRMYVSNDRLASAFLPSSIVSFELLSSETQQVVHRALCTVSNGLPLVSLFLCFSVSLGLLRLRVVSQKVTQTSRRSSVRHTHRFLLLSFLLLPFLSSFFFGVDVCKFHISGAALSTLQP